MRRSSSEPASPGWGRQSAWPKPESTTSSCWSAPTASAEPGATQRIRVPAATSRHCCTRTRSSRTRRGHARTRPRRRSTGTSRTWRPGSTSAAASGSATKSADLTFDEDAGVWTATTKNRKKLSRPHRRAGLRPAVGRQLPRHPGPGQLPRAQDPQRTLGSRLRLHRQAGRGHRHRCQRHPDHPRTGQAGRVRQGISAHPVLGAATPGRRHPAGRAGVVHQSPCHPTACAASAVSGATKPAPRRWSGTHR